VQRAEGQAENGKGFFPVDILNEMDADHSTVLLGRANGFRSTGAITGGHTGRARDTRSLFYFDFRPVGGLAFRSLKTCRMSGIWAKSFGRRTACLLFKIDSSGKTGTFIPCHRIRRARRNAASKPSMPSTLGRKFTSVSSASAATVGANMVPPSRTMIAVKRTNRRSGRSTQISVSRVVAGTP